MPVSSESIVSVMLHSSQAATMSCDGTSFNTVASDCVLHVVRNTFAERRGKRFFQRLRLSEHEN